MRALAVAAALLLLASHAGAQQPVLFLDPDHWALRALQRLAATGAASSALDAPGGSVTRAAVLSAFERAAASAVARGDGRTSALGRAYATRLQREATDSAASPLLRASLEAGGRVQRGGVLAGYDRAELPVPQLPLPSRSDVRGEGSFALRLGRSAATELGAAWSDADLRIETAYLGMAAGPVLLWGGRRRVAWRGPGDRSLVLQGETPFDGAGVVLPASRLPSPLRGLGRVRAETFFARLHAAGGVRHPWFWGARVELEPHPRLSLAGSRAAVFGGEGNARFGLSELPILLLGLGGGENGETENQVASVSLRWRPPTGALPVLLHGEWAFDDLSGSFVDVPGLLLGLELPSLPVAPAVALGIEWTHFARQCCGNPAWYRHSALPWLEQRRPLGHPLGGAGTELRAYGRAELTEPAADLRLELFRRRRSEDNLFSPLREGASRGARLEAALWLGGRLEPHFSGSVESGDDWREWRVEAGTRVHY